jgi:hypothetical protein
MIPLAHSLLIITATLLALTVAFIAERNRRSIV